MSISDHPQRNATCATCDQVSDEYQATNVRHSATETMMVPLSVDSEQRISK